MSDVLCLLLNNKTLGNYLNSLQRKSPIVLMSNVWHFDKNVQSHELKFAFIINRTLSPSKWIISGSAQFSATILCFIKSNFDDC